MDNISSVVTSKDIARETRKDVLLSKVYRYILDGWPSSVHPEFQPYETKKLELTIQSGCIMWGVRVVIPSKLQDKVTEELHSGHQGIVKMKQLARNHVWWYNIDKDLETKANGCENCWRKRAEPAKTLIHPWDLPDKPWQRLHLDFAGPINKKMYLIVIDSFSKWIEVIQMGKTTSEKVKEAMFKLFARWGLPVHIVTDNGPQFISEEFEDFLKNNGIKHTTTAPYKPSTNGAAERSVGIVKNALKAEPNPQGLEKFLMTYRNTNHSTTGRSPAELMIGRPMRTRLDLLRPNLKEDVYHKQDSMIRNSGNRQRSVQKEEEVLVRNYRPREEKWTPGTVEKVIGDKHYIVNTHSGTTKQHIDQIIPKKVDKSKPSTSKSPDEDLSNPDKKSTNKDKIQNPKKHDNSENSESNET